MTTKTRSIHIGLLLILTTCSACFPDAMMDGDGDTSGDDDGDSAGDSAGADGVPDMGDDGDGDEGSIGLGNDCASKPTIECDDLNRCWASNEGWPASAQWADPADIQDGVDAGTLVSVDLGNGAECYMLDGSADHPCVIYADCTPLLGQPLTELELVASDCAAVGGPWWWVGESDGGQCWGLVEGIAVRLK